MIGNGNGGIVHPSMMYVDPKVLQAIQYAQDLSAMLAGIGIFGVTKDGHAVNCQCWPSDPILMRLAEGELSDAWLTLKDEVRKFKKSAEEMAKPSVGKILRPPPIMGG